MAFCFFLASSQETKPNLKRQKKKAGNLNLCKIAPVCKTITVELGFNVNQDI